MRGISVENLVIVVEAQGSRDCFASLAKTVKIQHHSAAIKLVVLISVRTAHSPMHTLYFINEIRNTYNNDSF
jgi:hypothetical protein